MDKHFPKLVVFTLIFMLVAGALMSIFWIPRVAEYLEESCSILKDGEPYIYICFGVIAIPLFAIFIMAFGFVPAFKRDSIFDRKTARLIKAIADILLIDCVITVLFTISVIAYGELLIAPLFLFAALIGITVSFVLFILANHVEKASDLKEETEGIL